MSKNGEPRQINMEDHLQKELAMQEELKKFRDDFGKLTTAEDNLCEEVAKFKSQLEPIKVYFDRGSFLAKSLLFMIKWCVATVVGAGAVAGAWIALKSLFYGQN